MTERNKRKAYEFTRETKLEAINRSQCRCERCNKSIYEDNVRLEVHHRVPVFVAKMYPQFSLSVIKSLANAEVLCSSCHHAEHRKKRDISDYQKEIESLMIVDTMAMFVFTSDWFCILAVFFCKIHKKNVDISTFSIKNTQLARIRIG